MAAGNRGVIVDGQLRTSVPHIFAPGDVNGLSMLFHPAVRMSEVAAAAILGGTDGDSFTADEMPQTVFSHPEAMSAGLTEEQASRRGRVVWAQRAPMGNQARAQIAGDTAGFVKLVAARGSGAIVGMRAVGADADALAAAAHMAVRLRLSPGQLAQMTFPHPSQFEALDRLARASCQTRPRT